AWPGLDEEAADSDAVASPAPQLGADPGQQLGEAERLRDVVDGARVEAEDDVDLAAAGGKDDRAHPGMAVGQAAAQVESVAVGQAEVQQEQVGIAGEGVRLG